LKQPFNRLFKIPHILIAIICIAQASCSGSKKLARNQDAQAREQLAKQLGVVITNKNNLRLYQSIQKWMGSPHVLGGCKPEGVDCSCLVKQVFAEAYQCSTARDTQKLLESAKRIERESLKEGDLVFFSVKQNGKVDHVGIYLSNDQFVHTSVKKGVMISKLTEPYYTKSFKQGGRLPCN
jgi:cell wall-associated NlpC family hydrolase